ncbi:hypothetical protein FNYG_05243 [Fusarium nygamai]|uniref:Uncharacterized protein n=1 Tax=Gibberella nygamai TaxID=42673 RepID=A0A2K0WGM5_GIBNY|nr:hypothetical protein FNYG_05243 [Fusarium nygamai]
MDLQSLNISILALLVTFVSQPGRQIPANKRLCRLVAGIAFATEPDTNEW